MVAIDPDFAGTGAGRGLAPTLSVSLNVPLNVPGRLGAALRSLGSALMPIPTRAWALGAVGAGFSGVRSVL
jgi:hypothetical protein